MEPLISLKTLKIRADYAYRSGGYVRTLRRGDAKMVSRVKSAPEIHWQFCQVGDRYFCSTSWDDNAFASEAWISSA
jgi:hypothetical protein